MAVWEKKIQNDIIAKMYLMPFEVAFSRKFIFYLMNHIRLSLADYHQSITIRLFFFCSNFIPQRSCVTLLNLNSVSVEYWKKKYVIFDFIKRISFFFFFVVDVFVFCICLFGNFNQPSYNSMTNHYKQHATIFIDNFCFCFVFWTMACM